MVNGLRRNQLFAVEVDAITKIVLIIFVTAVSYFAFFLLLRSLFYGQPRSMHEMMHFNGYTGLVNLGSLSLALGMGLIFSLLLKTKTRTVDKYKIIKKALSEDEKAVIDEIRRTGRITQDSLRFRLGWSKSKVSRILTNLDKMNLIQRERTGKTYIVFLSGEEEDE